MIWYGSSIGRPQAVLLRVYEGIEPYRRINPTAITAPEDQRRRCNSGFWVVEGGNALVGIREVLTDQAFLYI